MLDQRRINPLVWMLTAMTTQSEEMDGYVIITGPANHHRDSGKCQTEAPSRYRMKFT